MRTSAALFPFCAQFLPFVKWFSKCQNRYEINKLISLPGLAMIGRDASFSCNHPPIGINVASIPDVFDDSWDTLLISRSNDTCKANDEIYIDFAKKAVFANKNVVWCDNGQAYVPSKLSNLSNHGSKKLNLMVEDNRKIVYPNFGLEYTPIETPVIMVGGILEQADTLELTIQLSNRFTQDGHAVTTIVRNPFGQLFGFHTINHILERSDINENEKIVKMNNYIRAIEFTERPDVIIVEAPDALLRYSDKVSNGFGVYTYILSQAVSPDYLILGAPFELSAESLIAFLSNDFSYRLGSQIHAVHVSNIIIDSMDMLQSHELSFAYADMDMVNEYMHKNMNDTFPLFNVISDGIDNLYNYLCSLVDI